MIGKSCGPRYLAPAFAAAVCWAFASVCVAQLVNSTWPDYGGGLANRHQANVIGPSNPKIAWAYNILQPTPGTSVANAYYQPSLGSDGTIYFLTYDGSNGEDVVALNPDGTRRWSSIGFSTSSRVGRWTAVDTSGQLLHMSGLNGFSSSFLVSRNAATGASLWIGSALGTPYQSGPVEAPNGTIYTEDDNSLLQSLTTAGTQNWTVAATGPYMNPAIATNGTLYTGGRFLNSVSTAGAVQWSIATLSQPVTGHIRYFVPPTIDLLGNIYAGTTGTTGDPGYVLSVDAAGNQRWRRDGVSGATAIGPDGTIYAGYQGTLHAMSPLDGHDLWTYVTGQTDEFGAEGVAVDLSGNIYVSTMLGDVLSLDDDGNLRWSLDLAPTLPGNVFLSGPVLGADGTLYVGGGTTHKFFAITNVPEPTTFALAACGALLFALHGIYRRR